MILRRRQFQDPIQYVFLLCSRSTDLNLKNFIRRQPAQPNLRKQLQLFIICRNKDHQIQIKNLSNYKDKPEESIVPKHYLQSCSDQAYSCNTTIPPNKPHSIIAIIIVRLIIDIPNMCSRALLRNSHIHLPIHTWISGQRC